MWGVEIEFASVICNNCISCISCITCNRLCWRLRDIQQSQARAPVKRPTQGDRWNMFALPSLRSFANAQDDNITLRLIMLCSGKTRGERSHPLTLTKAPHPGRPQGSHPLILTTPALTKTTKRLREQYLGHLLVFFF